MTNEHAKAMKIARKCTELIWKDVSGSDYGRVCDLVAAEIEEAITQSEYWRTMYIEQSARLMTLRAELLKEKLEGMPP